MRRFMLSIIVIAAGLAVRPPGASLQAQEREPIVWFLETPRPTQRLKPGSTFEARLTATIQKGWHLYALSQPVEGPMPTRLTLPDGQPFTLAGAIKSPPSYTHVDPNFGVETAYFEEAATFTLPIQVAAEAKAGTHVLQVMVRFQACNDDVCLPPTVIKRSAAVTVIANSSKDEKTE